MAIKTLVEKDFLGVGLDGLLTRVEDLKSGDQKKLGHLLNTYKANSADDIFKSITEGVEELVKDSGISMDPETAAAQMAAGNPELETLYLKELVEAYQAMSKTEKKLLGLKKVASLYDEKLKISDPSKIKEQFKYGASADVNYVLDTYMREGGIQGLMSKVISQNATKQEKKGQLTTEEAKTLEDNLKDSKDALMKYLKTLFPTLAKDEKLAELWLKKLSSGDEKQYGALLGLLSSVELSISKSAYSTMPKAKTEEFGLELNDKKAGMYETKYKALIGDRS